MAYSHLINPTNKRTAFTGRLHRETIVWLVWFAFLAGLSTLLALVMYKKGPSGSILAWLLYFSGIAIILFRPRYGIYIIISLGLAGDSFLSPWFPFIKNFSSRESLLFINDAIILNPLETYLGVTLVSWFIHATTARKLRIFHSPLLLPALGFLGFVLFGLANGVRTGGNVNIALWEARPFFYLVIMLFLVINLLEKREHINHLLWFAMAGIMFEAITANWHIIYDLGLKLEGVEAISEHVAAVHWNTFFVFFLATLLYKVSVPKRVLLGFMTPIVLLPYLINQRRASFVVLGIALIIFAALLYKEHRRVFWLLVPLSFVIAVGYLGVFWNQSGPLGMPAQAVKSIIAPDSVDAADQSSNRYRDLENYNLHFTLRQKPFTGIGFGQKFYIVLPMPDISWFQWWQFYPHNSVIWIWLKTGVIGFFTILYLFGISIMLGARALWRMPRTELSAVTLTAIIYLIMHFVFAYVDIGWDSQSMIYVGMMVGILGSIEEIMGRPVRRQEKRWHWQPDPIMPPPLVPLTSGSKTNTERIQR